VLEASRATGQKIIDGCKRDAERVEAWLKGNLGGAWDGHEVKVINNPYPHELRQIRSGLDSADFAFVSFSGHGYIKEDYSGRRTQRIILGDGTEIDFLSLAGNVRKQILICDACREVHKPEVREKHIKLSASLLENRAAGYDRIEYRKAFDRSVSSAPDGNFTIYSCSPNEYAGEDPLNGGFFTDALLSGTADWCTSRRTSGILTIDDAFAIACPLVKNMANRSNSPQNPIGGPSNRSGNPFPFGVSLQ